MAAARKLTFQLTAHGKDLEVRATTLGGQCRETGPMPPKAVLDELGADPTWISPSQLVAVGQTLYQSLVYGNVVGLASSVLEDGRRDKKPVHFELRFDEDQTQLAQYPWEMIADGRGRFLVGKGQVNLTRYITYPQPPPILDAAVRDSPLLHVVSQPATLPLLAPIELPMENVETLSPPTFEQLQYRLLIDRMPLWGLHFDGHGRLVSEPGVGPVGALAFEGNADPDWITTEDLADVLYNAPVQLAFLSACETALMGNDVVFSGLAPGLVETGVPAVVGMQYRVSDSFANKFVQGFYAALLALQDILDAFRVARLMNKRGAWYSPVLYLRHKRTAEEEALVEPVHHTRNIDTAAPKEAHVKTRFLVRIWIRRPHSKPLTEAELHEELAVPEAVSVSTREAEVEVRFEPIEGRSLRRGEVEVQLQAVHSDVVPDSIKLFVDEHLDAPPAIFTVQAARVGRIPLRLGVWQDAGQVAAITQHVHVLEPHAQLAGGIEVHSFSLDVAPGIEPVAPAGPPETPPERAEQIEEPQEREPERHITTSPITLALALVRVPAGEFQMGSVRARDEQAWGDELPPHSVHLPEFHIGRYPVTNTQYQAFVQATGHRAPEFWEKGRMPSDRANHPVVGVAWHNAVAFCIWLNRETGQPFRLPTEAEWEKAARGTDGRIYPWGDEPPDENRCNFDSNVDDTTTIGRYSPQGDSPYGCADMAGNVWEWCQSLYKPYPYQAGYGREDLEAEGARVLRGGAFGSNQRGVRCAVRLDGYPYGWYGDIGFRLVVAPGPPDL
jgi:formylglycine-generating enzyme required for sulfatase activity